MMKDILEKFNFEDISQIVVGAAVMAVPIAFSEELWNFGNTLPGFNVFLLFCLSLIIQSFYTYFSVFQGERKHVGHILFRVLINYLITFITVAVILYVLNRVPVSADDFVGLKRIIILCFPASLGAVIVDGFDKE